MSLGDALDASIGSDVAAKVRAAHVLLVGAGGIGCELLKNLVLSGFTKIVVVDLDTIDLSNLNRQFLFRRQHIAMSKAEVAAKAALEFDPTSAVSITPICANIITDKRFDLSWFRTFDIVMNALDNLEARRHVNRMCLMSNRPLVESGTAGLLGQATVHIGGVTECFDCTPKSKPKVFPVCTIRSTPSQPIHCIVWAKSYLFAQLFGVAEETQIMAEQENEDNAAELANLKREAEALKQLRNCDNIEIYPERIFRKVFVDDVARLAAMPEVWADRPVTPKPMEMELFATVNAATVDESLCDNSNAASGHKMWTLAENIQVFIHSCRKLGLEAVSGPLDFDKDHDAAMDFVTAAANLRAQIFGIPTQTRFESKQMAGNIIPAVATSNAIVAGLEVLMAFRVLAGAVDGVKTTILAANNPARLLTNETLQPPNPRCGVCSLRYVETVLDVDVCTLREFIDEVARSFMAMDGDLAVMRGSGSLLYDYDFEDNLDKTLSSLSVHHGEIMTVVADEENDDDDKKTVVAYISHSAGAKSVKVCQHLPARKRQKLAPAKVDTVPTPLPTAISAEIVVDDNDIIML